MRAPTLISAGLIFCSLAALGQQSVPVFRSPADSTGYILVQRQLTEIRKEMVNSTGKQRDSLSLVHDNLMMQQMHLLNTGVIRFRTIYQSHPALTSYADMVAAGNPTHVRTLSISGRNRKALPDSLFLCTNLEELELVNWKLRKLPRKLNRLKNLQEVTILNNQPSSPLRLPGNKSIKKLNIRGDEGNGKLPAKYRNLRNLETLDLARNDLTAFPNVRGCKKLTKVYAAFNEITLDELRGRQPASIMDLNLSNNKIRVVPDAIAGFKNVKKLNFNNNQVERVGIGIRSLKHLEEISFYKNKLKDIPEPVYALPSLKVIDLYFNEIEKADVRLGQMQSLEILYLANNRIYTLPDNLGSLPRLRELYLHNNRISNLPRSVGELQQLTVLRINNNSILEFPSFLYRLQRLQNLDFSHNQITSLDLEHFDYKELKILALVGNPWNESTREALPALAQRLRSNYKTVVHLNTYTDPVE